jgi:phosphoesterase RecJ-like protein
MREILRLNFPEKDVRLLDWQKCDYLEFLGEDNDSAEDSEYADALALVLDTATEERISNSKYKLCREIVSVGNAIGGSTVGIGCPRAVGGNI